MITEIDVCCHLSGENFSPKRLEQLINFHFFEKTEIGDLTKSGPNKNTSSSEAYCSFQPPKKYNDLEEFEDGGLLWMAETIKKNIDVFHNNGVEQIELIVGIWYDKQCNLVFAPKIMKILGELNIHLQVSCYED